MATYAKDTKVTVAGSRAEIEDTLRKYGADQFISSWADNKAVLGFTLGNRQVKFILPMPTPDSKEVTHTTTGKRRDKEAQRKAHEQLQRQRWRAMALVIKAKLEAVESGISTVEREFFYDIVCPNGQTVGQLMAPQLEEAYQTGQMPALLPQLTEG